MPLGSPDASGGFYINEGRYKAKLIDRTEELSKMSFDGKPPAMRSCWVYHLWDSTGEQLENDHGLPLEWKYWTSTALGVGSNARPMCEALLGKSIDGMTGDEVGELVMGKTCSVLIADKEDDSGKSEPKSWKTLEKVKAGSKAKSEEDED